MTAKVVSLTRYPKKGEPGESLSELTLLKAAGIEGDRSRGGERQVSLLCAQTRRWMEETPEKGLCFGRYKENILIDGLAFEQLKNGSLITVGSAALRITESGKKCFSQCGLFAKGAACRLAYSAVFAAVEEGGVIKIGDEVRV